MRTSIIQDAREYVIPLFTVEASGDGVLLQSRQFLGTAFFVTRKGDAITAAHVLPSPADIGEGRRLVAVVTEHGKERVCWVNHAAVLEPLDVALLKVNLTGTKFLSLSAAPIFAGTDIQVIGIPTHEVVGKGKEMRVLKGHVTMAHERLELSFPIPAGMSGSPVMVDSTVVGYATGRVRTEEVEDEYEEIVRLSDAREELRIARTARVTYYGLAFPFSNLASVRTPVLEGKTILEFVAWRNKAP